MIGILGGTFDPIHNGHLQTARDLLNTLALEQIRFIPSGIPPHRDLPMATAEQRLAMVRSAVSDESGFVVDEREILRDGPSYMVDSLSSLRQELGSEQSLALILGMDAFLELESWHQWQELIRLAHIIVMTRPGYVMKDDLSAGLQGLLEHHARDNRDLADKSPAGNVLFCEVTPLDISSTAIRQKLASGNDVSDMIPAGVLEIIKQQQIYS